MVDVNARQKLLSKQRDDELKFQEQIQNQVEAQKTQGLFDVLGGIYNLLASWINEFKNLRGYLPESYKVNGSVNVDSLPEVAIKNFPDVQKIEGQVEIKNLNFPDTVTIANFPAQDNGILIQILTFMKSIRLNLPSIYQVKGDVNVNSMPPVEVMNFPDLKPDLDRINQTFAVGQQNLSQAMAAVAARPDPKSFDIKSPVQMVGMEDLLADMEELKKGLNILVNKEAATVSFPSETIPVTVTNLKYPNPVTNISINALKGVNLATPITVTNTATLLPATNLANRRSLILYNNSNQTLYIGGTGVTIATGFPIPASTYSPPIDAGFYMNLYGIVASGSADTRILEVSDVATGR